MDGKRFPPVEATLIKALQEACGPEMQPLTGKHLKVMTSDQIASHVAYAAGVQYVIHLLQNIHDAQYEEDTR